MRTAAPLMLPLFRSRGQSAVLSHLFLSRREVTAADLAERAGLAYPTVRREIRALVRAGLVIQRRVGSTQLLAPNEASPFIRPLRELIELAFGATSALRDALEPIDGVLGAAIFGSYADRTAGVEGAPPADIDVIVIGASDVDEVYAACTAVARLQGRPVNPTILSLDEWRSSEPFVAQIRAGSLLPVLGDMSVPGFGPEQLPQGGE